MQNGFKYLPSLKLDHMEYTIEASRKHFWHNELYMP